MVTPIVCSLLVILLASLSHAAVFNVSNTIGSNMVLQRDVHTRFWGWGDPDDLITVYLSESQIDTRVNSAGEWDIKMPTMSAGGPYEIKITSSNGQSIVIENVLFGDVYVCSGQSNMQFTVDQAFNATSEVSAANSYPNIRVFSVGLEHTSPTPLSNLAAIQLGWSVASSATIGGGNWSYMSAVCWFFGRDLYDQYQVPIGLISTNWGGTYIQAWSSPDALAKCNATEIPSPSADPNPNTPSVLWNAMIVPFLPQSIKGALWYQGESNVGSSELYSCLFPVMISDWRSKFGSGYDFPFFFVHLAPWLSGDANYSTDAALERMAQLSALELPSVGYASAIDLGDAWSPFGSVHPRNKQTVARRLLAAARNIAYNETTVVWEGPTFQNASAQVAYNAAVVTVVFQTYGKPGLVAGTATCPSGQPSYYCANWEIQMNDGNWYPGTQLLSEATDQVQVILKTALTSVKAIRYCHSIWPLPTIFSIEGLPAIPFLYDFN